MPRSVAGPLIVVLLFFLFVIFLTTTTCARIDAGHVGIMINYSGSYRGVEDVPQVTGWVFYNRWTKRVFEYPTYVQTAIWTREPQADSPGNEDVSFNSKEGMQVSADISLSYQIDPAKVPMFYIKFRTDDLAGFTHGFMRNVARDIMNEAGGKWGVEEIYGPRKEEFLREVRERLNVAMEPHGIRIEQFGFVGAPRIPENVVVALNSKVQATQDAMRAENQLREATANAQIAKAQAEGQKFAVIQKAEGDAESVRLAAKAEADSKVIRAEGEARANERLARGLTSPVIEWRRLQIQEIALREWNGDVPQFVTGNGSNGFLLQLPALPTAAKR